MNSEPSNLRYGSQWSGHEGYIVGDEKGLRNLISACNTALESGEYYGDDLDDWVGVKKLDVDWFESEPQESHNQGFRKIVFGGVMMLVIALSIIGLVTVANWVA